MNSPMEFYRKESLSMDEMEQNQSPHGFAAPPYIPYYPQPSPQPHSPQQLQLPPQPQPSSQPSIIVVAGFGSESRHMICPYCQAEISTRLIMEPNMKTHLMALLLCCVGLCCCAPCIYCTDNCLVKKHYCPSCSAYLGIAEN